MYNFNLEKNENVIGIFDDVLVGHNDIEKSLSIAITNKRILFLDYQPIEPLETLKGAHASSYIKIKEVIYSRYLEEIKELKKSSLQIVFNDNYIISFDNKELYECLKEYINV